MNICSYVQAGETLLRFAAKGTSDSIRSMP